MFQSGYLGCYIGAFDAGQGYMTEALQLMLRTAFRTLRPRRWRDHERWALLATEWRSPRRSGHAS